MSKEKILARVLMTLEAETTEKKKVVAKALSSLRDRAAELGFGIDRKESQEAPKGFIIMWASQKPYLTRDKAREAAMALIGVLEKGSQELGIRECISTLADSSASVRELRDIERVFRAFAQSYSTLRDPGT